MSAGDLLASLELNHPSKVKKIATFEGALVIEQIVHLSDESHPHPLRNILTGFPGDANAAAAYAFVGFDVRGEVA